MEAEQEDQGQDQGDGEARARSEAAHRDFAAELDEILGPADGGAAGSGAESSRDGEPADPELLTGQQERRERWAETAAPLIRLVYGGGLTATIKGLGGDAELEDVLPEDAAQEIARAAAPVWEKYAGPASGKYAEEARLLSVLLTYSWGPAVEIAQLWAEQREQEDEGPTAPEAEAPETEKDRERERALDQLGEDEAPGDDEGGGGTLVEGGLRGEV